MLHVVDQGQGEIVVPLHSGGMSSRQWKRLTDRLLPHYRVICPDFLGSGANPPWPASEPFDFRRDVEAVAEILQDLDQPVHLVGHSYGGLVALTLAGLVPERTRSVSVYDPVAFGILHACADAEGLADLDRAASDPAFHSLELGGKEAWLEAFIDYWNGPGSWRKLPEASRAAFLQVGRKVFLEVSSLMQDRTPRAAYAAIQAPTLLCHGQLSPAAARRVVELLRDTLPAARLESVAGAGHMGPITHAETFNLLVLEHVRGTGKSI